MNLDLLHNRETQANMAVGAMNHAVTSQVPLGMRVEYQHGEHWIGPCLVVGYRPQSGTFGPKIVVKNLKTGKERAICSYDFVRPEGGHQ